jgi:hypothetical protein
MNNSIQKRKKKKSKLGGFVFRHHYSMTFRKKRSEYAQSKRKNGYD